MYQFIKTNQAVAKQGGAPEADTGSKNGVESKSLTSSGYLIRKIKFTILFFMTGIMLSIILHAAKFCAFSFSHV